MSNKIYITGKPAKYLRGLGHHLTPMAMIGKEGLSDNLLAAVDSALTAHELIKVKLQDGCPYEKKEAAEMLAQKSKSAIAQIIGKTFLLYRVNKKLKDDKRITLPKK